MAVPCAAYSTQNSQANSDIDVVELSDIIPAMTAEDIETLCEELVPQVYQNLSGEAQLIFDQCLAIDPELLQYHCAFVDSNYIPSDINLFAAAPIAAFSAQIAALALPSAVSYALNAMASALSTSANEIPLPLRDILSAAATVNLVATCALNWATISNKWPQIVQAFTSVFTNSVNNFVSAMEQIKADSILEYYKQLYPVSANQLTRTVTIGYSQFKCDTVAEDVVGTFKKGNNHTFLAFKNSGLVYISSVELSKEVAVGVLACNWGYLGTMSVQQSGALELCDYLGGPARNAEIDRGKENTRGWWYHYHPLYASSAHAWFMCKYL